MLFAKLLFVALAAATLAPCDGLGGSDGGTDTGGDTVASADAVNGPVVDDVILPQTATIDISTGVAHIIGSISFHDDFGQVVGVNVLGHGTNGSIFRGSLGNDSPQPLIFDLSTPGVMLLDFNVFDQTGNTSAPVTRTISVM
jgi:hypothetical protein